MSTRANVPMPSFNLMAPDKLGHAAACLLYTSDAADERSRVDLGGRRSIKKKKRQLTSTRALRDSAKESKLL